MKLEDFQKLQDYAQKEVNFNEDNALDKSVQISNLYVHFLKLYSKEAGILKMMNLEKEKIYGELFHWYRRNVKNSNGEVFQFQIESAKEAEIYIKSNQTYYDIALKCSQQEVQVNYIEQMLSNINNLGFRLSSYISLLKIKKGLM